MSKSQRDKGHRFERDVVNILKERGVPAARNLTQTRDSGGDIIVGRWLFECKRYASIAVYKWLDQAVEAADESGQLIPVVVAKADRKEPIVILRLSDFLATQEDLGVGVGSGPREGGGEVPHGARRCAPGRADNTE